MVLFQCHNDSRRRGAVGGTRTAEFRRRRHTVDVGVRGRRSRGCRGLRRAGARITFAEWIDRARAIAAQFVEIGVAKGDVVALWLPSGIDYATCYAAAAMIGAITTGLNPRLGWRELESILQQADPRLIVADGSCGALPDGGAGCCQGRR